MGSNRMRSFLKSKGQAIPLPNALPLRKRRETVRGEDSGVLEKRVKAIKILGIPGLYLRN